MGIWKKIKPLVETGEHLHFGGMLLDLVFDWRVWLWGVLGGVVTLFTAAYDGRSVTDVLLAAVLGLAVFALFAAAVILLWRVKIRSLPVAMAQPVPSRSEFDSEIPDVRVADDPVAWGLFETNDRDKLFPLLEQGKIHAWGRLGNGPLTKIPADQWSTHYLDHRPADSPGRINQTFFRPKSRPYESTYYDVHLNRNQLERAWPGLSDTASLDRIPCTELLRIAAAGGWDFTSHNSLHLVDLQDAMRQGGADNTLTIWGRANKWTSEQLMRNELLEKISPDHWKEFFVHLYAATQDDNFNTYSWVPDRNDFGRRGYVDLHVGRSQAMSWLRQDASSFKGKTKSR
jgi:hypothetical protein